MRQQKHEKKVNSNEKSSPLDFEIPRIRSPDSVVKISLQFSEVRKTINLDISIYKLANHTDHGVK